MGLEEVLPGGVEVAEGRPGPAPSRQELGDPARVGAGEGLAGRGLDAVEELHGLGVPPLGLQHAARVDRRDEGVGVLLAEDAPALLHRVPVVGLRLGQPAHRLEDDPVVVDRRESVGVVDAANAALLLERLAQDGLRLGEPVHGLEEPAEVPERGDGVGVLVAEDPPAPRKRLAQGPLGLDVLAEVLQEEGQVVHRHERARVVGADGAAVLLQRLAYVGLRLGQLPLVLQVVAEVVDRRHRVGVLLAEHPPELLQGLAQERLGLDEPPPGEEQVPQVADGDAGLGSLLAERPAVPLEGIAVDGFGLLEPAERLQGEGQVPLRRQRLPVVLAEDAPHLPERLAAEPLRVVVSALQVEHVAEVVEGHEREGVLRAEGAAASLHRVAKKRLGLGQLPLRAQEVARSPQGAERLLASLAEDPSARLERPLLERLRGLVEAEGPVEVGEHLPELRVDGRLVREPGVDGTDRRLQDGEVDEVARRVSGVDASPLPGEARHLRCTGPFRHSGLGEGLLETLRDLLREHPPRRRRVDLGEHRRLEIGDLPELFGPLPGFRLRGHRAVPLAARDPRLPGEGDGADEERRGDRRGRQDTHPVAPHELPEAVGGARRRGDDRLAGQVALDVHREGVRRRVAPLPVLLQRPHHDPVELAADDGRQALRGRLALRRGRRQRFRGVAEARRGLRRVDLADDPPHLREPGRPQLARAERGRPRQQLVEEDAEGIDVRPRVDVERPLGLLRAHVLGGPDHRPVHREERLARRPDRGRLGDAEVDHLRVRLAVVGRDEDVRRLDVAVDETLRVGVLDGVADLGEELEPRLDGQLVAVAVLRDRRARDEVHHEVGPSRRRRPRVDDARDVRVVHHREGLALQLEARHDLLRVHSRLQELHRDPADDRLLLLGEEDRAEAPLPDPLQEPVGPEPRPRALEEGPPRAGGRRGDRRVGREAARCGGVVDGRLLRLEDRLDAGPQPLVAPAGVVEVAPAGGRVFQLPRGAHEDVDLLRHR